MEVTSYSCLWGYFSLCASTCVPSSTDMYISGDACSQFEHLYALLPAYDAKVHVVLDPGKMLRTLLCRLTFDILPANNIRLCRRISLHIENNVRLCARTCGSISLQVGSHRSGATLLLCLIMSWPCGKRLTWLRIGMLCCLLRDHVFLSLHAWYCMAGQKREWFGQDTASCARPGDYNQETNALWRHEVPCDSWVSCLSSRLAYAPILVICMEKNR